MIESNKDFAGKNLEIGDIVATTFGGSASLKKARVTRFTYCKVGVLSEEGDYYTKFPYQVSLVESLS